MAFKNVCIIGAGFGGICAAVQLQRLLKWKTFTIYEANEDVGGCWLKNNYPGCGNDNASLYFTYSFEPKADFSQIFASSEETCSYLRDVAIKYNIYPRIKFNTKVNSVVWDEEVRKWDVTVANNLETVQTEETLTFDIVICATGHFRVPIYPEEFLRFKGPIIHTAEWNNDVNLEEKVVAVIGSGASAVQLIPAIVDKVTTIHSYQRQPIWGFPFRPQMRIPDFVKWIFANVPFLLSALRIMIYIIFELFWLTQRVDLNLGNKMERFSKFFMRKQIPDNNEKCEALTPKYKFGCKRPGFVNDYYSAMGLSKVKLHTESITSVTENSIITKEGHEEIIDVLILATGFDSEIYFGPMQIVGKNGENVLNTWQNSVPSAYFGVASSSMPNLFFINGPYSDSGNNISVIMIEMQTRFILRILEELIKRKAVCVAAKPSSEKEYLKNLKSWSDSMVQGKENCGSYYKNRRNQNVQICPLPFSIYWLRTKFPDYSKFKFYY